MPTSEYDSFVRNALGVADRARRAQQAVNEILNPQKPAQPPLVGVGGLKGRGKDSFADYLVADHGYFKTFMSEPLTLALSVIGPRGPWVRLDFDIRERKPWMSIRMWQAGDFIRYAELVEVVGYTAAKEHRDAREYLQGLGTEVGRNMIGENTWTDIALEKIRAARADGQPVVITGIRYPNELELVRSLDGFNVWIDRPLPTPPHHPLTDAIDEALGIHDSTETHSSETTLSAEDFDVVVENTGTLADLRESARQFALEMSTEN